MLEYKRVALCLKCKKRHLGNPEQCPRCGNTKFRRCDLRKGELEKFMLMENKIYEKLGGAFELVIAPKFGIEMPTNAEMQSSDFNYSSPNEEVFLPNRFYESENNGSDFFEKNSITGEEHRIHGEVGRMQFKATEHRGICPFCRNNIIRIGGRSYLENGIGRRRYQCVKCKKWFQQYSYYAMRTPDYIIDFFIDIFSSNSFFSQLEITKIISNKFGYKISQCTIGRWMQKYRKKKLWKGRIPNARFNPIKKPEIDYIPKVTIFQQRNRWGQTIIRRNEYGKPMSQMQENNPITIP